MRAPSQRDEPVIKRAITERCYDALGKLWRLSPFEIERYDPIREAENGMKRDERTNE